MDNTAWSCFYEIKIKTTARVSSTWAWYFSVRKKQFREFYWTEFGGKWLVRQIYWWEKCLEFFSKFPVHIPVQEWGVWTCKNVIRTMVIWPDFSTHGIGGMTRSTGFIISEIFFRIFRSHLLQKDKKIKSNFNTFFKLFLISLTRYSTAPIGHQLGVGILCNLVFRRYYILILGSISNYISKLMGWGCELK